jgi:hypothetical protein
LFSVYVHDERAIVVEVLVVWQWDKPELEPMGCIFNRGIVAIFGGNKHPLQERGSIHVRSKVTVRARHEGADARSWGGV